MSFNIPDAALPVNALKSFLRPKVEEEACDFCNLILSARHRHLLEMNGRKIRCVCDPCALRFENVTGGRFKLIPRDPLVLRDFHLSDAQWSGFALPINLAFFYHDSASAKVTARYPSPGGSMESLLTFRDWKQLADENSALQKMQPDVEALLINRIDDARNYFITPIDACYELSGLVRKNWRGLSGGEKVWCEIAAFFKDLKDRAISVPGEGVYAGA